MSDNRHASSNSERPAKKTSGATSSNRGKPFKRTQRPRATGRRNQLAPVKATEDSDSESDAEVDRCIICTERIAFAAISDCNHVICQKCFLRQRALYEKELCIVCRTENRENTIVSEITDRNYNEFSASDIVEVNEKYKVSFTSKAAIEGTLGLLENVCTFDECEQEFKTFKQLSDHVRNDHDRYYCFICANHKKFFPQELKLFTYAQLKRHQRSGDGNGFTGHPRCQFCSHEMFYSEDEKSIHLRDRHEKCHVCNQIDPVNPNYFRNYEELYSHFTRDHFICTVQSCLDKKFVAFADELSLRAHMINEHKSLVGNSRTLQTIGTNYGSFAPSGGNGSSRRYQSSLSTFQPVNGATADNEPRDSYDTKRRRLEERAKHYLSQTENGFSSFLQINKDFLKNDRLSAEDLFSEYQELFSGNNTEELSFLIHEITELLPKNNKKRKELQQIASDYFKQAEQAQPTRSQEDQFPLLHGASSSAANHGRPVWTGQPNSSKKQSKSNSAFPVLGGSRSLLANSNASWGSSRNQSLGEAFPALQAPANKVPVLNNTVRYKTLTRKKPFVTSASTSTSASSSRSASPSINASDFAKLRLSDSSASWADNNSSKRKNSSASSSKQGSSSLLASDFPSLPAQVNTAPKINRTVTYTSATSKPNGKGKTALSSNLPNGKSNVRITVSRPKASTSLQVTSHSNDSRSNGNNNLNSSEFPALPQSNKKPIPRVNEIDYDPKQWGKQKTEDREDGELQSLENSTSKKKKKQKQVLFHLGI